MNNYYFKRYNHKGSKIYGNITAPTRTHVLYESHPKPHRITHLSYLRVQSPQKI